MQAVFRLVKNFGGVALEHLPAYFFPAAGRQRMLQNSIGPGSGHHLIGDGIPRKIAPAPVGLSLHARGNPHVGLHIIGALGRLDGIAGQQEPAAVSSGKIQNLLRRVIPLRAGHPDVHPGFQRPHNQAAAHIVAVADVGHFQPFQAALVLAHGHQIRQHLAGVRRIGHPVDDGNPGIAGKIVHFLLIEGADHQAVDISRQRAGRILHRFAAEHLQVPGGEEQCMPAQLVHARFKGHAGTGADFLKNHAQGFPLQARVGNVVLHLVFQLVGRIEDVVDLLFCQIHQAGQMFHAVASFRACRRTATP